MSPDKSSFIRKTDIPKILQRYNVKLINSKIHYRYAALKISLNATLRKYKTIKQIIEFYFI